MNLIDIRGTYLRSAKRVAIGMLAVGVVGGLLFWSRTDAIYWFAPIVLYCFLVGAIMGLFYAIAEVIRHSLSNMLKVVELMLEVTKKVAADVASVSEGKSKMPSAKELVEDVYRRMSEVAANESKIVSVLNWTQAKVVNVGARFRFAVMLPHLFRPSFGIDGPVSRHVVSNRTSV